MSKSKKAPAMSTDSGRMGRIPSFGGVEGNTDHAQGAGSRSSALSGAVSTLNTQVARHGQAPTVGGRKMTDR